MGKGLLVAGEAMGLFIAQEEGSFSRVRGYDFGIAGAEYNVAVGVARLGHLASYLTKLGRDPFGEAIQHGMEENGIDTRHVSWSDTRRTGFMLKSRVSAGDPAIFYFRKDSAASTMNTADIEAIDWARYSNLHVTGITPALSDTTYEMTTEMMAEAHRQGLTVSFDPNIRPALWPDEATMCEKLDTLAAEADVVLPGVGEGRLLTGSEDPHEINSYFLSHGAKLSITKCGSKGALVATAETESMVAGYQVDKVVDTVGAGDGFAVGVRTWLMEGLPPAEAALRGNAIGAIQVMHRGDNEGLPTREELEHFVQTAERKSL